MNDMITFEDFTNN